MAEKNIVKNSIIKILQIRFFQALIALAAIGLSASAFAGEVYYPTGTYYLTETDLRVAARGIPMTWERSYRSNRSIKQNDRYVMQIPFDGLLGFGWTMPWSMRIDGDAYVAADGRYFYFQKDVNGNYLPDKSNGLILTKTASGYEVQELGANTMIFDGNGKLMAVKDPRGRSATLNYDGAGNLTSITDVMNRTIFTFTYAGSHISQVKDLSGRAIDYQYDASGNLIKASHDGQAITTYSYNTNHGMASESPKLPGRGAS